MIDFFLKKGSIFASFFIISIFSFLPLVGHASTDEIIDLLKVKTISSSPTWLSLLHVKDNKPYITDKSFLLTQKSFSSQAELLATLEYLYSGNIDAVCRFPARYLWLKKQLNLKPLDVSRCADLTEFETKAPIDEVYLAFASENITQPASMMGHVFIKISGLNEKGVQTNHAISFYTNIEGFNLPKIIYQSFFSGKKGYFSLSPYSEKLVRYNEKENRNVWEYKLDVDSFHKQLLQYHFYELKQTKLTYYFDSYNCATLMQFILGVINSKDFKQGLFGTSPIDVVKQIENHNLYKNIELIPSKKWKLRMLNEYISHGSIKKVKQSSKFKSIKYLTDIKNTEERFIAYDILQTHIELNGKDEKKDANSELLESIQLEKDKFNTFDIDLSDYKSPTKTPPDSQISIEALHFVDDEITIINLVPTSHKLEDDNRQYFGETSLILGEVAIARSQKYNSVFIDHLTLFESKSLIPHEYFTGGISGSFRIAAKQQYDVEFKKSTKSYIDGSIGKTYGIGPDINIYALLGGGLALSRGQLFTEINPEFGIIIREVFNMKSIIQYQHNFNDSQNIPDQYSLSFTQSLFIGKNWGLFGRAENVKILDRDEEKFSIWIKHYF